MATLDASDCSTVDEGNLRPVLSALADQLLLAASRDPELRRALRDGLSRIVATLDSLADHAAATPAKPAPDVESLTSPAKVGELRFFRQPIPPPPPLVLPPAAAVPVTTPVSTSSREPTEVADDELPLIARRCQMKAEGARWAAERQRLLARDVDFRVKIAPRDADIIARARSLPDCFLWMCQPHVAEPEDPAEWELLARGYEGLAEASEAVHQLLMANPPARDLLEQSVDLLAEAQSAVRVTVTKLDPKPDADQERAFRWLTRFTREQGVFVHRHMRLDDPAEPADWHERIQRIESLIDSWRARHTQQVRRRSTLRQISYHADLLLEDRSINPAHDWKKIVESVDKAVTEGRQPSDSELRQVLLPVLEWAPRADLPELDMPKNFRLVLNEIDRYLESRPAEDPDARQEVATPDVSAVRALVEGTRMVLIGGYRRRESQARLERAFGLEELRWVVTAPHQSLDEFDPIIASPGVSVVLLAIRWSSHSFGGVRDICQRHDRTLVRLPAGYGVNRVASEVMRQGSEELRLRRSVYSL